MTSIDLDWYAECNPIKRGKSETQRTDLLYKIWEAPTPSPKTHTNLRHKKRIQNQKLVPSQLNVSKSCPPCGTLLQADLKGDPPYKGFRGGREGHLVSSNLERRTMSKFVQPWYQSLFLLSQSNRAGDSSADLQHGYSKTRRTSTAVSKIAESQCRAICLTPNKLWKQRGLCRTFRLSRKSSAEEGPVHSPLGRCPC